VSNHAAIAAVTATLTNMIQGAVAVDQTVSSGTVTARPPDRARQGASGNQINLFLYRTTIDAAWRNQDAAGTRAGESGQPPLPLVLTYLITAYGENDEEILAHRLLGIAMGVLNDKPLLSRKQISNALAAPGSDLENQVERVRITPDPRPQDEISRMWATFGTGYRLSVSYDAAVVLIESTEAVRAAPPVLMRGPGDTGPTILAAAFPELQLVQPPNRQGGAQAGDVLTLTGRNLALVTTVQLSHPRLPAAVELVPRTVTGTTITVQLPNPPMLPAGVVAVSAVADVPGTGAAPRQTIASNAVPVALAPAIVGGPLKVKLAKQGPTALTVNCAPPVEAGQTISLIVGSELVKLAPLTAQSSKLTFELEGLGVGKYMARLRVDSVDSIPAVLPPASGALDQPATSVSADGPAPLTFDPKQLVVLQ
jgi:hypothetical protein